MAGESETEKRLQAELSAARQKIERLQENEAERIRTEAELNRLTAEQELILENTPLGIAFLRDRVIIRCNRRFEEMFGYAGGELVGQSTVALYPSSSEFERVGEAVYPPLRDNEVFSEQRLMRRKTGVLFWSETRAYVCDPKLRTLVWNIEEIWQFEQWLQRTVDDAQVRKALALIEEGRLGIAAGYANMHTGLMGTAEMHHFLYPAQALKDRYGLDAVSVVQNDVPGFSWAFPQVLARGGIKYLLTGPNTGAGGGGTAGRSPSSPGAAGRRR